MFNVSIMSIGDEICIGQIVNSNAAWIAYKFTDLGANVFEHITIGDDATAMKNVLDELLPKSDLVLLTGGLGPTHDDITKPVLVEYFDDELEFDEETYENICILLERRGLKITERIKQMSMLPKSCKILYNGVGAAPGMLFERNGKYVVSLPGVPSEMKFIMTNSVLPMVEKIIDKLGDDIVLYKTLMTSGVPESVLADKIGNVDAFLRDSDSLAFLPSYKGVRLRIGVRGSKGYAEKRLQEIEKYIRDRVDEYIIAGDDVSLAEVVGKTLADAGETVAVAESCTGGLLGGEFTSVSGSSAYFAGGVIAYSNEIKEKILGVEHQILIEHGAVSRETAEQMAQNVRSKFNVDYGISITGIAGPTGGTPDKPVGTVWIAVSSKEGNIAKKFNFGADRNVNRQRSVGAALNLLLQTIKTTGK